MPARVVMIGAPGSGKSTIGQAVAELLGVAFRDTDVDVEREAGIPISDIFVQYGEPNFRVLERASVARALAEHDGVLALGGGSVLDPETRADLSAHTVVFLDVGLADAAHRVGLDTSRPLLLGNVRGQLKQLMDARRPIYLELATITVATDGRTPEDIASEIVEAIRETSGAEGR